MRSFVAMELPEATADGLVAAGARIRVLDPGWAGEKWVAPSALHVTLEFLGDRDASTLDALTARLRERLAALELVDWSLAGLRAVPSLRRASMLWAVPSREPGGLREAAAIVRDAAAQLGIDVSDKPFVTHVTLVRARRSRRVDPDALSAAWIEASREVGGKTPFGIVSGREVTVFTSTLTRSGPVYEVWDRAPLGRA
jgi:2'-5' RNA ligase